MTICNATISIWHFLNENIVSALIGATAFALIGAGLLRWSDSRRIRYETMRKMKELIGQQITDNLDVQKTVYNAIQQGGVHNMPAPFRTSAIQTFLQAGLIDKVSPETAYLIIDLNDKLILANGFYSRLIEYAIGIHSATSQSSKVRKDLMDYLKKVLPLLKTDLEKIKKHFDEEK